MKSITFSIKGLLAAVTMIAVGLFALLNANPLWDSIIVSLTLLLLLTSLLAPVYRRGEPRSFWIGFAIFGWGYFILTNPPLGESYRSLLPTHLALEMLHESVSREFEVDEENILRFALSEGHKRYLEQMLEQGRSTFVTVPSESHFVRIGHCLWAWLLALIGGFLARHFYLVQERSRSAVTE